MLNIVLLSAIKKFSSVNVISNSSLDPHPVKKNGVAWTIKVRGPNNSQIIKLDSGNIALDAKKTAMLNSKTCNIPEIKTNVSLKHFNKKYLVFKKNL